MLAKFCHSKRFCDLDLSYWPYHKFTSFDFQYCCSLGTDKQLSEVASSENNYSWIYNRSKLASNKQYI